MDAVTGLSLALDPTLILKAQGITPDPWQRDVLYCPDREILLNCCRGSGKSRTTSALALHHALFTPQALVLLISKAQRQAQELYRYVKQGYAALERPIPTIKETETQLELANGSRIISLPGKEGSIRSYQGVTLLIVDEAARVPDDLIASVSPMTRVRKGRFICLSTPYGQRGFFYREWEKRDNAFRKFKVTWKQCPRITDEEIDSERKKFGDLWIGQEYECSFSSMEGLVYPDFANKTEWTIGTIPEGNPVGGIDFGWRNPFAALWGVLDRDDVLWIHGERYLRECPLHEHAKALKATGKRMWYADPAGRTEIEELRTSNLTVRKGDNEIRLGIMAVSARINSGRLKVHFPGCLNLIEESRGYRYPRDDERRKVGENPIDDHNHALGALRYMVSKIDARFMAKLRKKAVMDGPEEFTLTPEVRDPEETIRAVNRVTPWLNIHNDEIFESWN